VGHRQTTDERVGGCAILPINEPAQFLIDVLEVEGGISDDDVPEGIPRVANRRP
jgi:hypothetical protein